MMNGGLKEKTNKKKKRKELGKILGKCKKHSKFLFIGRTSMGVVGVINTHAEWPFLLAFGH